MAALRLEKAKWHPFLDNVSKILSGKRAEIQVAALNLGAQVETEWMPLLGLVYDPKDDIIEVALEDADHTNVDHMIQHPRDVFVEMRALEVSSLEVIDGEGQRHIVQLRDPIMLPAPP